MTAEKNKGGAEAKEAGDTTIITEKASLTDEEAIGDTDAKEAEDTIITTAARARCECCNKLVPTFEEAEEDLEELLILTGELKKLGSRGSNNRRMQIIAARRAFLRKHHCNDVERGAVLTSCGRMQS